MNEKLKSFLINTALLFMIAELSYINSKSLLHLAADGAKVHQVFAIVGAIAFSLVTIIVMQQPTLKWQKVVFPVFDAALVFGGFNLDLHPNMRIYLTIFMALFAGCIMYSLGKIEYHHSENLNLETYKNELEEAKSKLLNTESKFADIQGEYDNIEGKLISAYSKIEVMEPDYIKYKLGRLSRKKKENLTPEDLIFLKQNENTKVA